MLNPKAISIFNMTIFQNPKSVLYSLAKVILQVQMAQETFRTYNYYN